MTPAPRARVTIATRVFAAMQCLMGNIQASRRTLPWKRVSENVKFHFGGFNYQMQSSRYEDGRLAEVFLATAKTGEMLRGINRDSAIAVSLALQYGCPIEVLRDAMGREEHGGPESPIAAALDIATGREVKP